MKTKRITAKQLLSQYPDMPLQESCTIDLACPKCGHRDDFKVAVLTMANLTDDGTDCNVSDHEWDGDSVIQCGSCRHTAYVRDFKFKGLDELIKR